MTGYYIVDTCCTATAARTQGALYAQMGEV
eukprot:SAG25_NODE_8448_length_422_cov_0.619195_1_plen_29_part_10